VAPKLYPLVLGNPVALAFAVTGDAWTQLILREAFFGARRFSEWRERLGLPRSVLTDRLRRLLAAGILELRASIPGGRSTYRLTAKGLDLYGIALMQGQWERRYASSRYQKRYALALFDRETGKPVRPGVLTREFGEAIDPRLVSYKAGPSVRPISPPALRRSRSVSSPANRPIIDRSTRIIGDFWTWAVLSAAFFRIRRFDELTDAIGVATNILADRLSRLIEAGILEKRAYQSSPERFEYRLTQAGRDLYPTIIAMFVWSERWLCHPGRSPLELFDRRTGERLAPVVADLNTGAALDPRRIRWQTEKVAAPVAPRARRGRRPGGPARTRVRRASGLY